ncbi:MAG TPA: bi-domain-containing oxidoreductase [Pyrinomonadaceae bacterium]|nr:bi-domain-containing oxidoreductase [Pyrinomonadaceae bacterium]
MQPQFLKDMKQVLQNLKTGDVAVTDVPTPLARPGFVLVRTAASLISAGTERMTVEAGQKSLLGRAVEQPNLVKQVIQKAKSEGVLNTIDAVRSKLGSLVALGYSTAGTVVGLGDGVGGFHVGDRVACAGVGYASHAEVLSVPKNLCVRVPESVSFDAAAFSTLGAIALQGVRLAELTLGESVVVIGLGLIGQLTVQLLNAHGCRVFGIDLDETRVALAQQLGADDGCAPDDDARQRVMQWSRGHGADAVLITAATSSNEPVELAGEISRQKGRVIAVGAVGLSIPRQPYYNRELTFKISMSYGPGRYDPEYEERGHDYPLGYVRWTEGRNLEAFLDLLAEGRVNVEGLITHRFKLEQAEQAYQLITGESSEPYLGVVLQYDSDREVESRIPIAAKKSTLAAAKNVRVGLIGAGNYARAMLLPHFKSAGAEFHSIATASGVTARQVGERYGFRYCVSSGQEVIDTDDVNLIVIATRHDTHAELARRALERGRHVFVEKPLALNHDELKSVITAAAQSNGELMVGYNRRFSPLARTAKEFFDDRQAPLSINYRINAGRIPREHWAHNPREGGGRLVGEVCHFIDFMHFITGSLTKRVYAESIASRNQDITDEDSVFITLRFADGSNGSIAYLAEGDKALPKERVEIFCAGKTFVIDDFRSATAYHNGREKKTKLREQDKGQKDEVRAVCAVVLEGAAAPIALNDLATTTRATFRIRESLRTGLPIEGLS